METVLRRVRTPMCPIIRILTSACKIKTFCTHQNAMEVLFAEQVCEIMFSGSAIRRSRIPMSTHTSSQNSPSHTNTSVSTFKCIQRVKCSVSLQETFFGSAIRGIYIRLLPYVSRVAFNRSYILLSASGIKNKLVVL
jgi:hypothetical protein